jgi:glycosyltransferase involved in cell wall biosynthesis
MPLSKHGPVEWLLAGRARRVLAGLLERADFVHLHELWQPILAQAALLSRARRVCYAISPRATLNVWSLKQKFLKKKLAYLGLWRSLVADAAFIHALTQEEQHNIEQVSPGSRCVRIPNGVFAPPPLAALAGKFRSAHPDIGAQPYILFLSRLHHKKGLDLLVPAFRDVVNALPDAHLVIAGPDEGALDGTRRLIAQCGLAQHVHLVGPLYGDAKFAALADASVFCLPSRDEGFSMAVIEAMATGRPVVISRQCNFPEVTLENAGIECALDPGNISHALLKMLRDREFRETAGANAKRMVERDYTWPSIAARMVEHYASAVAAARPERRRC